MNDATEKDLKSFDVRRIWYLSLGVVTDPNKPGRIRLAWDAAAQVDGVSLNDKLLTGSDILASLVAAICQVRVFEVLE